VTRSHAALEAAPALHPIPRDGEGPIFDEPWEAQAFAMVVALHKAKLFSWGEWSAALSREIVAASQSGEHDPDGSDYSHWLSALETLVVEKGAASRSMLEQREAAWARAAEATPHGEPILLANEPQSTGSS
jgi:nitrile hydratase accessory protein